MATSDPEAPMLLLSPKDQEVLGIAKAAVAVYSLSLPEDFVLAGEQVIPPYMMPETEPVLGPKPLGPPQKAEVPVPKDAGQTDKRKERTPEEVETRFQELLKQYGISN